MPLKIRWYSLQYCFQNHSFHFLWSRAIHRLFQSDEPFLSSDHGSSTAAALVSVGTQNIVLRLLVSSGLKLVAEC